MEKLQDSPMVRMALKQEEMSEVEQTIADFFTNNTKKINFSAARIAKKIHVSEASLSRFAQKMGYHGYREFIYQYQKLLEEQKNPLDAGIQKVFLSYDKILSRTMEVMDQEQIERVVSLLLQKEKIFVYGFGSSGIAGEEFVLRLLRMGVDAKVITDFHQLVINENQLKQDGLVIGISLSGETPEIIEAMNKASEKGTDTILITSNTQVKKEQFTEIMVTATEQNMKSGMGISPQLPILIILDLLYEKYLERIENDKNLDEELWNRIKKYHIK